jgi:hypothetical protein
MVANSKLSWVFLRQFNFSNPPEICLGRSSKVMEKYIEHKNHLDSENIDINNYINSKYFSNNNRKYYIDKNQFPYYCDDNIEHYVMWINFESQDGSNFGKEYQSEFRDYICYKMFNNDINDMNKNCIYFQNLTAQQSIKGVPHLQIFIRKKNSKL